MPHRPDLETHLLKRELLRSYLRQGLRIPEMLKRLDQNGLFSPAQSYGARYSVVVRLLRSIRKEDAQRYRVLRDDAERAWCEYVTRQEFLYMKAVECGDYELAAKLSKDIARAHGVVTDEPIKIETDILTQMGAAFALGEKKMQERRVALNSPVPALDTAPRLLGNGKDKG